MKTFAELLQSRRNNTGISPSSADEKTIAFIFDQVITQEYGDVGSRQVNMKTYRKGVVYVALKNSVWANEIWIRKELIRRKINDALGCEVITHIRIAR